MSDGPLLGTSLNGKGSSSVGRKFVSMVYNYIVFYKKIPEKET